MAHSEKKRCTSNAFFSYRRILDGSGRLFEIKSGQIHLAIKVYGLIFTADLTKKRASH